MAERDVVVCECAARDGLQHESEFVPTARKIEMIDAFSEAGFRRIEVTSFSHPKYVPQFADAEQVLRGISRRSDVSYKAVCVNGVAVQRAADAVAGGWGPDEISVVVSASEKHSIHNTHQTHDEARTNLGAALPIALDAGLHVGGTIGTAFGCPFTGPVDVGQVAEWVQFFIDHGVTLISLGDTTGMATPRLIHERVTELRRRFEGVRWIAHLHDTRGLGLANTLVAIDAGVTYVDASFGGLGGHPSKIKYAEGHTGNVATEDLLAALDASGITTGIHRDRIVSTARLVEDLLGRELDGRVARSGLITDLLPLESVPVS